MKTNIRMVKNNKIYVEYKDMVVVVQDIYEGNIPDYVPIVEVDNNFYIKGTEPIKDKSKKDKKQNKEED